MKKKYLKEDIEEIEEKNYESKIDKYFNSFYKTSETFIDYIKDEYIIFIDEISKIKSTIENILKDNNLNIKTLIEKNKIVPESLNNYINYIKFLESIKTRQTIYLEEKDVGFIDKQNMHAKRNGYSFSYREVNFFRSSMDLLFEEIQKATKSNKKVILLTGDESNIIKIEKLLKEKNINIRKKHINFNWKYF